VTRLIMVLIGSLLVAGQAASQVLDRTIGDVITGNNGQGYVSSNVLNVELALLDAFNGFWRVTSLQPAAAVSALSQFDDVSGTLDINDAIEIDADGSTQMRSFRLKYLPESDPPVLQLETLNNATR